MSTLVYVGANLGYSLESIAWQYDKVYAFEPYPKIFNTLVARLGHVANITFINAACAEKTGEHDFYVYPNMVSSALAPNAEGVPTSPIVEVVKVNTINLYNYLQSENVDSIDYYVSDCQGSDLMVLKTIKQYIDNRNISRLMIETHNDRLNLYEGLDNRFQGFKDLLENNYKIDYISLGSQNGRQISQDEIPDGEYEWDTIWSLKY